MGDTTVTAWQDAEEALGHGALRQALYDDRSRVMADVVATLDHSEHRARRDALNAAFTPTALVNAQSQPTPLVIPQRSAAADEFASADLCQLVRSHMAAISAAVAGIDLDTSSADEREKFSDLINRLERAARTTAAHADREDRMADGDTALTLFAATYYRPAADRRRHLLGRNRARILSDKDLPNDALTQLLRNQGLLGLADEVILRDVAYVAWRGANASVDHVVHALHHIFEWVGKAPQERERLVGNKDVLQGFVQESMRLHPDPIASRIAGASIELASGKRVAQTDHVTVDVVAANRDAAVFGARPDTFNPDREIPAGVPRHGLTLGVGSHACAGAELVVGTSDREPTGGAIGVVTEIVRALLIAGVKADPSRAPASDGDSWLSYPVVFD